MDKICVECRSRTVGGIYNGCFVRKLSRIFQLTEGGEFSGICGDKAGALAFARYFVNVYFAVGDNVLIFAV